MDENQTSQSNKSEFHDVAKILRKLGGNAGPRPGNYFSIPQSSGKTYIILFLCAIATRQKCLHGLGGLGFCDDSIEALLLK
jgi:hypothetical protein